MDKDFLFQILNKLDVELKDFTLIGKESDIINFYKELNNKYEYDLSQFLIIQRLHQIKTINQSLNDNTSNYQLYEIVYTFKIMGIDYDFFIFLFNDNISITDLSYADKQNNLELIYNGRREFGLNQYATTDILVSKIIDRIKKDKDIEELFNYLKKNCYPNVGGYTVLENAFLIGTEFFEKENIKSSLKYFELMKRVKGISELTISEFYKKTASLFYEKGYKAEALAMINFGLELNPKLSVKNLIKKIENESKK